MSTPPTKPPKPQRNQTASTEGDNATEEGSAPSNESTDVAKSLESLRKYKESLLPMEHN